MKIEIEDKYLIQSMVSVSNLLRSAIDEALRQFTLGAEIERARRNIPIDGSWRFVFWIEQIGGNKYRFVGGWVPQ